MELFKLLEEYKEKYPNEESLMNLLSAFDKQELLEIMKEANGRKIKFEFSTERLDDVQIAYE
jgi:hypothetical protein